MPYKPMRPCRFPGCPKLTSKTYCTEHEKQERKRYDQYERRADVNKIYGRQWKKLRALYISHHPVCEQCQKEGRLTPVDEVHHIVPVNEGGRNEWDNLMSLCKSCHQKMHQGTPRGGKILQ